MILEVEDRLIAIQTNLKSTIHQPIGQIDGPIMANSVTMETMKMVMAAQHTARLKNTMFAFQTTTEINPFATPCVEMVSRWVPKLVMMAIRLMEMVALIVVL